MTVQDDERRPTTADAAAGDESERHIDLAHDYALDSVPTHRRRGGYALVAVWVGWAISVSSLLVGGAVGAGTTFGVGLTAIIVGNVFLAVVGMLVGYVGYRTGLTTYLASRLLFGTRGSVVSSLVLGVLAMGFIGVLMDAFGTAMTGLVPQVPWTVFVIAFAVAITVTAMFGFRGLAVLSVVAAPVMVLFGGLSLFRIGGSDGGFSAAMQAVPESPIGFTGALTVVIATWITGAALVCDIGRYAKRPLHIGIGAVCGYVVGAGSFEATSMLSASAVGNENFVVVMSQLGLLLPAAVVLALTLWTTTDNNLYSASLAFTNASTVLGRNVDKRVWVLVSVGIAVMTAFGGFAADFEAFLLIIATVTPPFAGIFLAHFYVLGHLREDRTRQLANAPTVRWTSLAAWAVTSVAVYVTDVPLEPVTGLVAAGALYTLLSVVAARATTRGSAPTTA
jgi:cytosine permease